MCVLSKKNAPRPFVDTLITGLLFAAPFIVFSAANIFYFLIPVLAILTFPFYGFWLSKEKAKKEWKNLKKNTFQTKVFLYFFKKIKNARFSEANRSLLKKKFETIETNNWTLKTNAAPLFEYHCFHYIFLFIIFSGAMTPFSIAPLYSFKKWLGFVMLCFCGAQWVYFIKQTSYEKREKYRKALFMGCFFLASIFVMDMFMEQVIHRTLKELSPALDRSHAKLFTQSSLFLSMAMWIFLGYVRSAFWVLPLFLLAFYYARVDSLTLGYMLAILLIFLKKILPSFTAKLRYGLGSCVMLAPFIAHFAFCDAHIPFWNRYVDDISLIHRMSIWHEISKEVQKKPLLGHGFKSTSELGNEEKNIIMNTDTQKAHTFHVTRIGLHAHNFALQFWLEFGLIGALLMSVFITKVFLKAYAYGMYAFGCFLTALSIVAFNIGVFQAWWIATLWLILPFFQKKFTKKSNTPSKIFP